MHPLFANADRLSGEVICAAIEVHRIMEPGRNHSASPARCKQTLNRRKRRQRRVRTEPRAERDAEMSELDIKEEHISRRLELRDSTPQIVTPISFSYSCAP